MTPKTAILTLLGISSLSLSAQIAYQGRLTDNTGAPLPNGAQTVRFDLFPTSAAGSSAWHEVLTVDTIDGRFSVTLGADGSINNFIAGNQFLQLTIGGTGGTALSPRQEILPAPRAVVADTANGLGQRGTKPYIMLDTANDRIGVNTESPDTDLHIDGVTKMFHGGPYAEDTLQLWKDLDSTGVNIFSMGLHAYGIDTWGDSRALLLNARSNNVIRTGDGGMIIDDGGLSVRGGATISGTTTVNGTIILNGQNVINQPATASKAISIINTPSATFKRPFEIFDGPTLVLGYQWNTPSTGLFIGRGTAFKPSGGAFAATSDARLKKNVNNLEGSLDRLEQLRPVTFEFKNEERHGVSGLQTGFIAQEVEKVFPEWICPRDNSSPLKEGEIPEPDEIKAISITGFEALTVDAFRELRSEKNAQIAELKKTNESLEKRVQELENKMTVLILALDSQSGDKDQTISVK